MRKRLIRRDIAHLFATEPTERSAACGKDQPIDLGRSAAPKTLSEGRVLGVDSDDLTRLGGPGNQRSAHHQRLFVGQSEDPACL
jgi:hypothetical protein